MSEAWNLAVKNLKSRVGETFKGGAFKLVGCIEEGPERAQKFIWERTSTGSQVRISRASIEGAHEDLEAGHRPKFQGIDNTVLKEFGIVAALQGYIAVDEDEKRYQKRAKGARSIAFDGERCRGKFDGLRIGVELLVIATGLNLVSAIDAAVLVAAV